MRCIDADALIEKLCIAKECNDCKQNEEPYCRWKPDVVDICEAINDAPTIETERKRGTWYKPTGVMPPEHFGRHRCSECDGFALHDWKHHKEQLTDFCPYCGCKMER